SKHGKFPGSLVERNFPSVKLIGERILRIDPDSKIIGGNALELDRPGSVNGGSGRKAERLQDLADQRIDPGSDNTQGEVGFDIVDRQLVLTKIAGEPAGPDAFIPDDPRSEEHTSELQH